MEKVTCDFCGKEFEFGEVVSSHDTIFDDEFMFSCKKCLDEKYMEEFKPSPVEIIESIVEKLDEVECPFNGYAVEENVITYSYLCSDKNFKKIVVFEAHDFDEALEIICEL